MRRCASRARSARFGDSDQAHGDSTRRRMPRMPSRRLMIARHCWERRSIWRVRSVESIGSSGRFARFSRCGQCSPRACLRAAGLRRAAAGSALGARAIFLYYQSDGATRDPANATAGFARAPLALSAPGIRREAPEAAPAGASCFLMAWWQNGHAAACKAVYAGSIPTHA